MHTESLGRPRRRWENNINIREAVWEDVAWIYPAQDGDQRLAFVDTVMTILIS
jgi:hypothetical protein